MPESVEGPLASRWQACHPNLTPDLTYVVGLCRHAAELEEILVQKGNLGHCGRQLCESLVILHPSQLDALLLCACSGTGPASLLLPLLPPLDRPGCG